MTDTSRHERILVVEDEARLRQGLMRAIPAMGFIAQEAASAEDAMKIMEHDPCAVVVLDLRLPRMDGMSFFEVIRKRWPNTQVIIVTGYGSLGAAQQAVHLDAVEFLSKPCALKDLEAAISRACQRKAMGGPAARIAHLAADDAVTEAETPKSMEQMEREHIFATLRRLDGNRTAAAKKLGISRRTLHNRLREYKLLGYVDR